MERMTRRNPLERNDTTTRIPQQIRSQRTKAKLLDAGLALFLEKGFHATNSKEIAKKAGVAVGSFYAYFKDKRGLLQELLDTFKDQLFQSNQWDQTVIDEFQKHPKRILTRILKNLVYAHVKSQDMHNLLAVISKNDPELKAILDAWHQRSLKQTREILGKIRDCLIVNDFEAAVMVINTTIQENVHLASSYSDPDIQESLISEIADMLSRYLFSPNSGD